MRFHQGPVKTFTKASNVENCFNVMFVVIIFDALAQASDFQIKSKGDMLPSSAECRIQTLKSEAPNHQHTKRAGNV